jgi:hypothetical protein
MKRTLIWTGIAIASIVLALVGSICPPSAHLPLILATIAGGSFIVAVIEAVRSVHAVSGKKRVITAALASFQILGLLVVGWLLIVTARGPSF